MSDTQPEDPWSELGKTYVDAHYGSLRGRVRTHVIHQHLLAHLAPAPLRIVDVHPRLRRESGWSRRAARTRPRSRVNGSAGCSATAW